MDRKAFIATSDKTVVELVEANQPDLFPDLNQAEPMELLQHLKYCIITNYMGSKNGRQTATFYGILYLIRKLGQYFEKATVRENVRNYGRMARLQSLINQYKKNNVLFIRTRMPAKPDFEQNAGTTYQTMGSKSYEVPVATSEQTEYLEKLLHYRCDRYIPKIKRMSIQRLTAFAWRKFMSLDGALGRMPGLMPHRSHKPSAAFKEWESYVWDCVALRELELGKTFDEYIVERMEPWDFS